MEDLLENRPLAAIRAFFAEKGYPLTVHCNPPPAGTDLHRRPREVRRALAGRPDDLYWVDLGDIWQHYGSGASEEKAIRRAARRYRVEQADPDASRASL